jgi:hypothetical protein
MEAPCVAAVVINMEAPCVAALDIKIESAPYIGFVDIVSVANGSGSIKPYPAGVGFITDTGRAVTTMSCGVGKGAAFGSMA